MDKRFKIRLDIGKVRYSVTYHDGVKKHKDGSDFFDLHICRGKREMDKFTRALVRDGYREGY